MNTRSMSAAVSCYANVFLVNQASSYLVVLCKFIFLVQNQPCPTHPTN